MRQRMAMFLLGATLALGFAFSAYLIAQAMIKVREHNTIRVKGSSMRVVKSDFGLWNGSIKVQSVNLQDAYRKLENDRLLVGKFLKGMGFSESEIQFDTIQIGEICKRDAKGNYTNDLECYVLSQMVSVRSSKVDAVEKISRDFTKMVQYNVFATSNAPSFIVSDLEKYKMALLAEATKNGTERAEILAKNSGGAVGELVYASQGVFQITAPASGAMSDYGEYDKTTVQKEVKAVVTLEFKVQK